MYAIPGAFRVSDCSPGVYPLFAAQAARSPDAVAIVCGREVVTYGELAAWAGRLAARMQEAGVGPEVLVGGYMERRPEMVAGFLAVLATGAAYVPLDSSYPRERLRSMGEQIRSPLLLTQPDLLGSLPFAPETVLFPGRERHAAEAGAAGAARPPGDGVEEGAAACVVFTSGSTGRPKGIVLTHGGLRNLIQVTRSFFGLGPGERILQFSSLSFDISIWEIFLALTSGATLCLTGGGALPIDGLHRFLSEQEITFTILTPTVLRLISPEDLATLRTVVSGGEACSAEILRRWWAPGRRFFNCYGPTEIMVAVSFWQAGSAAESPCLGQPFETCSIHVLDGQPAPVGPGEIAELFIGGPGVARGYLHRPDLTAERFLPDPFSNQPGARLYRSGDLGRRRQDGLLEYLGRADHQVKIGGVRIEPGEIEAALRAHPSIRDAVVIVREDPPGPPLLVAYLVAGHGCPPDQELRQLLGRSLLPSMVPSVFIHLDAIPLSPNGKLDSGALPAPERAPAGLRTVTRQWKNRLEGDLAEIWEEILGRPVGPADDFFLDLGGYSLTAIRLSARIEERLHLPVSPATLLEAPTVERLAERLREGAPCGSALVAIRPREGGQRPPLFFAHGADGSVFYYRRLAEHLGPDQPFYGIQALSDGRLPASAEEMAARYVADVKAVQPRGPYFLGGYCMGGTVALEMAHQLRSAGEEIGLLALVDTYDWSRIAPGPGPERLGFLAQKLAFHGRNVLLLPGLAGRVFLRDKARWAVGLISEWRRRKDARSLEASIIRLLSQYAPGFYPGTLIHFRSKAAYHRYRSHDLSAGIHAAGVEMEEIPVFPGGILVEPFVRRLAERIRARLPR